MGTYTVGQTASLTSADLRAIRDIAAKQPR